MNQHMCLTTCHAVQYLLPYLGEALRMEWLEVLGRRLSGVIGWRNLSKGIREPDPLMWANHTSICGFYPNPSRCRSVHSRRFWSHLSRERGQYASTHLEAVILLSSRYHPGRMSGKKVDTVRGHALRAPLLAEYHAGQFIA